MSAQKSVEKKPYLKRGTRQFLSNAQVRSQSTKPKIVDFGGNEQETIHIPIGIQKNNRVDNDNDEIQIKAKPTTSKIPPPRQQPIIKKNDKFITQKEIQIPLNKVKRETSVGKKKQAALSDYLDNDSELNSYVPKRNTTFKEEPKYKKNQPPKKAPQSMKSTTLVQQELESDDEEQKYNNESFKPINNPLKSKNIPQPTLNNTKKQLDKKMYEEQQQTEKQEVVFLSDKSDDEQNKKIVLNNKLSYKNVNKVNNNNKQIEIQNEQNVSKIKMNYFNKANNKTQTNNQSNNHRVQQIKTNQKVLHINDVPKELRQLIVQQELGDNQQKIMKQWEKLKSQSNANAKLKQNLEAEQKLFARKQEEFKRQMQQKSRQFEQKKKTETLRLTKDKKISRDAQMYRDDPKIKNDNEQLKRMLQKQKDQRKKVQSKLKSQVQILRQKLKQQTQQNQSLAQQIKILEKDKVLHRMEMAKIKKQQQMVAIQQRVNIWQDAPKTCNLNKIVDQSFSLIEMDMDIFNYECNQYYQYYLKIKDNYVEIEQDSNGSEKAKRVYKNGKIEIEYYQKFLKEIFPFDYTIVNMWNGDVKQLLPNGIQIYFSKNNGATQFMLKTSKFVKDIVYFPMNETVQMSVTCESRPSENFNELMSADGVLKRIFSDGSVQIYKKNG